MVPKGLLKMNQKIKIPNDFCRKKPTEKCFMQHLCNQLKKDKIRTALKKFNKEKQTNE